MTDQDPLVAAIKWGSVKLAKATKEAGKSNNDVPSDLYDNVMAFKVVSMRLTYPSTIPTWSKILT